MAMHVTTVRFGAEAWQQLTEVCERDGIGIAQYIREATIAALARSQQTPQLQRHDDELNDLRRRVDRLERMAVRRRPT